jgi:hypothetical protein
MLYCIMKANDQYHQLIRNYSTVQYSVLRVPTATVQTQLIVALISIQYNELHDTVDCTALRCGVCCFSEISILVLSPDHCIQYSHSTVTVQ